MNIVVNPGVVVQPGDTLTADLLNQGFNPSVQSIGLVEAADIANGAVNSYHLNPNLLTSLDNVTPDDTDHLLIQKNGLLGKATIQDLSQGIPGAQVIERAMLSVSDTQTAANDELVIYRPGAAEGQRVLRTGIDNLTPDVFTAGTYRVGSVTVDNKGRITGINESGGTVVSTQQDVPGPGAAVSWPHGLGQTPSLVQVWLHRIANPGPDELYDVGDRVDVASVFMQGNYRHPLTVIANATHVIVSRCVYTNSMVVFEQDGSELYINTAHWKIVICARL